MNFYAAFRSTTMHVKVETSSTETINGAALPLQSVNHVESGHGLPACMLCVCDRIAQGVLQECLQDSAGFLVDEAADTLHATSPGKTTDCWLSDAGNVVLENLPVPQCSALADGFLVIQGHFRTLRVKCLLELSFRV